LEIRDTSVSSGTTAALICTTMLPAAAGTMASADVVIHCDLNKTLLAKDEVKR